MIAAQYRHGRKEPYTASGIKRLRCIRCGSRATEQWSACSDNNLWRPFCTDCDIALNALVLEFVGFRDAKRKMREYVQRKAGT